VTLTLEKLQKLALNVSVFEKFKGGHINSGVAFFLKKSWDSGTRRWGSDIFLTPRGP
jgi:hypothetical protein